MKNRIAKLLFYFMIIAVIYAFYVCLQYAHTPLLAALGILLTIASALVACIDERTRRSRCESPLDYTAVKGFHVKERYCTIGDENMALLTLYNQSKRAHNVTVTVTYLNVAGRVLGQEKQTVTGFVRGMEKHLCFRPGRDFHTFSYTLETSLFRGVSAERDFRSDGFQVKPLYGTEEEEKPRKGIYPVQLHVTEEYVGTREVEVACTYILLDKHNTVHGIHTPPPRRFTQPFPARTFLAAEFAYPSKGEIPIDEELPKEGVTGICVYTVTPVHTFT